MTSDIPDEWSSAARQISHGAGVLGGSDSSIALFETTLNTMFCIESSRLIWKGGERATKILIERWMSPRHSATLEAIIQAEYDALKPLVEKWDLTPRRVVVGC